jgi:adenine deaminase
MFWKYPSSTNVFFAKNEKQFIFWWWPMLSVVISRDLDQFILTHRHRKWSQTKWLMVTVWEKNQGQPLKYVMHE